MVDLDNSSRVGLETTLDKWSFSVENRLDLTPIEEGYEAFSFGFNSINELTVLIMLVSVPKKVEDESIGVFFLE